MRRECEICGRVIGPWDTEYLQMWPDGSDLIICEACRGDDDELRYRTETGDGCDLR